MSATVLIVDDEPNIRSSVSTTFRLEGYRCLTASDGAEALDRIESAHVDLVLLDLQMPVLDGLEVLERMRRLEHPPPAVMLTAHGSIEKAVEAVRRGAYDFLEKPPQAERMLLAARNALRHARLEEENRELIQAAGRGGEMIGSGPAMEKLRDRIARVAPTRGRVLVLGENGTGKELVARAIHRGSPRAGGPFVCVNCAAIPRELFESELFGHERGAFTGATARRIGKLVRADGGTLFLDEVGEIPIELQPKLLRALESGRVEPVGADAERTVDVRVVSATHRDLEADIEAGRFREDLYYRLRVVEIEVPPLRERLEDLPDLVDHFLDRASRVHGLRRIRLDRGALERLRSHPFPGNVRELKNLIERIVILATDERVGAEDIEEALPSRARKVLPRRSPHAAPASLREVAEAAERHAIVSTLEREGWNVAAAARSLDVERSHLYKKMRAHGIDRPEHPDASPR